MWFKQLIIYQLQDSLSISPEDIHEALEESRLRPCPPHARETLGWVNPMTDMDEKVYSINGCHMMVAAKEVRLLPSSVIQAVLQERVNSIELSEQRQIGKSEARKLKEDIEFDLLPKAFTLQKKDWLYIDTMKQWVVVNTTNRNKAADLIALLNKAIGPLSVEPLAVEINLSDMFSRWLCEPRSIPADLSLGQNCVLVNSGDDKSQYSCKNIERNNDEIEALLQRGYAVHSIDLNWSDRIQFTLTNQLGMKRLKCMEYLQDTVQENNQLEDKFAKFDADVSLLVGEVRTLVSFLISLCKKEDRQIPEDQPTEEYVV